MLPDLVTVKETSQEERRSLFFLLKKVQGELGVFCLFLPYFLSTGGWRVEVTRIDRKTKLILERKVTVKWLL